MLRRRTKESAGAEAVLDENEEEVVRKTKKKRKEYYTIKRRSERCISIYHNKPRGSIKSVRVRGRGVGLNLLRTCRSINFAIALQELYAENVRDDSM